MVTWMRWGATNLQSIQWAMYTLSRAIYTPFDSNLDCLYDGYKLNDNHVQTDVSIWTTFAVLEV